tara:strand:+ start:189 stop:455 length:267 start_codon:yes stop_codon:yes gene_type:complete
MGLAIPKYPVYNNATTVNGYSNIRNIRQDKREGKYILNGIANISTNSVHIETLYLELKSDEIFVDAWVMLYNELKKQLTEKGIEFIDN